MGSRQPPHRTRQLVVIAPHFLPSHQVSSHSSQLVVILVAAAASAVGYTYAIAGPDAVVLEQRGPFAPGEYILVLGLGAILALHVPGLGFYSAVCYEDTTIGGLAPPEIPSRTRRYRAAETRPLLRLSRRVLRWHLTKPSIFSGFGLAVTSPRMAHATLPSQPRRRGLSFLFGASIVNAAAFACIFFATISLKIVSGLEVLDGDLVQAPLPLAGYVGLRVT